MQDRAEDLALQIGDAVDPDQRGGTKCPSPGAATRCRSRPSASAASI
jgi:hypothetical protein